MNLWTETIFKLSNLGSEEDKKKQMVNNNFIKISSKCLSGSLCYKLSDD